MRLERKRKAILSYVERRSKWHLWFAWRPVRINDTELAWLQQVARRSHFEQRHYLKWEHRYTEYTDPVDLIKEKLKDANVQ